MSRPPWLVLAVALVACHPSPRPPRFGGIAGFVVDADTGAPIAAATVSVNGDDSMHVHTTRSASDGGYTLGQLPTGRYGMLVLVPGLNLHFTGIPVAAGHVTGFDVPVEPGEVDVVIPFSKVSGSEIRSYASTALDAAHGRIEGTVTDTVSLERQSSVVVVATSPAAPDVLTVVTDDSGHYRIDNLAPGAYVLSAYYNVASRGQIEVRRSDVVVTGGHATVVPLFVELSGNQ